MLHALDMRHPLTRALMGHPELKEWAAANNIDLNGKLKIDFEKNETIRAAPSEWFDEVINPPAVVMEALVEVQSGG